MPETERTIKQLLDEAFQMLADSMEYAITLEKRIEALEATVLAKEK